MSQTKMRPILLKGHERSITHIQYNTDGDLIFTASKSFSPTVWQNENGERIGTYNGHGGSVWYLDVSEDSKWMVSGSGDQTARVWEVETGKQIAQLKHNAPVRCTGWALGGHRFFPITDSVMGNIPTVQIYKFNAEDAEVDPTPIRMFQLHKSKVLHAKWVHLNQTIYTACEDGSIRVYDAETGKMTSQTTSHRGAVNRINFDKYEGTFVSASKDGTAKLFDAKTLQVLKTYDTGRPINCAVISPLKDHIIIGGGESAETVTTTRLDSTQFRIRFFHKVYETEICSILGHFGTVNSVAVSPDGKSFASGAEDGYVRLHHLPEEYVSNNDK